MTHDEALARIDSIEADPSFRPGRASTCDARRLIGMLPERSLGAMTEGWIRQPTDDPNAIEFFWSNSFKMNNPGQRITTIRTLGDGTFAVALRGSSQTFDETKWQRVEDGTPMVGRLSLADEGAQNLLEKLGKWQVGGAL